MQGDTCPSWLLAPSSVRKSSFIPGSLSALSAKNPAETRFPGFPARPACLSPASRDGRGRGKLSLIPAPQSSLCPQTLHDATTGKATSVGGVGWPEKEPPLRAMSLEGFLAALYQGWGCGESGRWSHFTAQKTKHEAAVWKSMIRDGAKLQFEFLSQGTRLEKRSGPGQLSVGVVG